MSTRGHWIRKPFTKDNNKTISSVSFNVTYSIICIKDSLMSKYDQLIMFYGIIRHDASYFHTMIVGIIMELNNIAKKGCEWNFTFIWTQTHINHHCQILPSCTLHRIRNCFLKVSIIWIFIKTQFCNLYKFLTIQYNTIYFELWNE